MVVEQFFFGLRSVQLHRIARVPTLFPTIRGGLDREESADTETFE